MREDPQPQPPETRSCGWGERSGHGDGTGRSGRYPGIHQGGIQVSITPGMAASLRIQPHPSGICPPRVLWGERELPPRGFSSPKRFGGQRPWQERFRLAVSNIPIPVKSHLPA